MPEVDLGSFAVNTPRIWISFTPIVLDAGSSYSPVLKLVSANPSKIYSLFKIRYKITVQGITYAINAPIPKFHHDLLAQYFRVEILNLGNKKPAVTFEAIRIPYYSSPGLLSDVTANLKLDDKLWIFALVI